MKYDMKQSGARIRQFRRENGLTQEEVATALNIDRSFYGRIESGQKGCSVDILAQLSCFFDVPIDYLVFGNRPIRKLEDTELLKENVAELIDQLESFLKKL